ncbi:MAG: hypothetical protein R2799_16205 [Crocinitomicaceae bacterium]|nr:hypothetical protein [Crocinitomicaceae bacterium]
MAFTLMTQFYKILLFVLVIGLSSCGPDENGAGQSTEEGTSHKGTVKYKVSYPYFKGESLAKAMLPKEMYFVYEDGLINTFTKKGGLMRMGVMGSPKLDSVSMYLDFGNLDIRSNFSGTAIKSFIESQTKLDIQFVEGETKKIAGLTCKKAIGKYMDGSNPDFTIWYTEELGVEKPNFYNPYAKINGVLMEFEMERFGLVSHCEAESYSPDLPEQHEFMLDTNFLQINFEKFENEIRDIFEKTVGEDNLTPKDSAI